MGPSAMRKAALEHATLEQLQAAALSIELTVEQYRLQMTQREFGDNCMIAFLANKCS